MSIVESSNNDVEIRDIDLSPIRKQRFRINGDNTAILELNTTDMGILTRLNELYPKLSELEHKYADMKVKLDEEGNLTEESSQDLGDALKDIDTQIREVLDRIFDSNVSEVCAPSGTMLDPINGLYRFEHIIDVLSGLYEKEITENMQRRKDAINKHTAKYTKSRSRKK